MTEPSFPFLVSAPSLPIIFPIFTAGPDDIAGQAVISDLLLKLRPRHADVEYSGSYDEYGNYNGVFMGARLCLLICIGADLLWGIYDVLDGRDILAASGDDFVAAMKSYASMVRTANIILKVTQELSFTVP